MKKHFLGLILFALSIAFNNLASFLSIEENQIRCTHFSMRRKVPNYVILPLHCVVVSSIHFLATSEAMPDLRGSL